MSWKGFLPDNAIVMRRRMPAPSSTPSAAEESATSDEDESASADRGMGSSMPSASTSRAPAGDSLVLVIDELSRTLSSTLLSQGEPDPSLLFLAQGHAETNADPAGPAFPGAEGQLLEKMIAAMGVPRAKVHLLNLVTPDEGALPTRPFLLRAIAALSPRVVVALGKQAAQTLLESERPISGLRGKLQDFEGAKLIATFHPADLLRAPDAKREAWEDLKQVAKELALPPSRG